MYLGCHQRSWWRMALAHLLLCFCCGSSLWNFLAHCSLRLVFFLTNSHRRIHLECLYRGKEQISPTENSLIDQLDSIYQDMHGEYCSLRRKTNWEEKGWCIDPEVRKYFHEKFAEYEVLAGSFEKKYFGFAKDQYYKTIRLKYDCFKETIFRMFAEATG